MRLLRWNLSTMSWRRAALAMEPSMRTQRTRARRHAACSTSSMTRLWLKMSVRWPSARRRLTSAMTNTCTRAPRALATPAPRAPRC